MKSVQPVDVVAFLRSPRAPLVFLDGGLDADGLGRWSHIASDPIGAMFAWGSRILHLGRDGRRREERGDPLSALATRVQEVGESQTCHNDGPPVLAGAFGWLGYELGRTLERLPVPADDRRRLPDVAFWLYPHVLAYDAVDGTWHGGSARQRAAVSCARPQGSVALPGSSVVRTDFDPEEYERAVARLVEHIFAGDVYQVNLSQRFHGLLREDPWRLYCRLREHHPAPLGAYIEAGNRAVLSNSPELFVAVRERNVETRPIKGTRARGSTATSDRQLRDELLKSEKDDAELTMIVDLMRNDLGRVAEPGSVQVVNRKRCVTLPTVHHLVATVVAKLLPDVGPAELLRATFPAGSITGCPKVRAMQLIAELEPCRRGVYTGAIGWISATGDMKLSVAIRTLTAEHGRWSWHAGGGIVADSDPRREYDETLAKSTALASALGVNLAQPRGGG